MFISLINKIQDTKKAFKVTFGIGAFLVLASMIYLFVVHGYNQAFVLGSVGLMLVIHGLFMIFKPPISIHGMIRSYNIACSFLFISWAGFSWANHSIVGIILCLFLSVMAIFASKSTKKNKV